MRVVSAKYLLISSALIAAALVGCRTTNSGSRILATGTAAPTPLPQPVGGFFSDSFPNGDETFTLTSPSDGIVQLNFSYAPSGAASPTGTPTVTVTDAADPTKSIASGALFKSVGAPPGYFQANLNFAVKTGGTYLLTMTCAGLKANSSVGISSQYLTNGPIGSATTNPKIPVDATSNQQSLAFLATGSDYDLTLVATGPTATTLMITASAISAKPVLVDPTVATAASAVPVKVSIVDGGTTFDSDVPNATSASFNAQVSYLLQAASYPVKISSPMFAPGTTVALTIQTQPITMQSGRPITAAPVAGMLPMVFEQTSSLTGLFDPSSRMGFVIQSQKAQEGKVDLNLQITRFANRSAAPFPSDVGLALIGPDPANPGQASNPPVFLMKTVLQPPGSIPAPSPVQQGSVVADFQVGVHPLMLDPTAFVSGDIITFNVTVAGSNLTIDDGGKPASSFTDVAPVKLPPPNDYSKDQGVTTQPHVPAVAPLPLAQASVLNAMEGTRAAMHQRIPKGVARKPSNAIDAATIQACLGNTAPHWSDLIIHFYCQHGQARACYTGAIRGGQTRTQAFATCATDPAFKQEIIDSGMTAVFQYVMESQTYAFDDQQVQDVINSFYRINNPADPVECAAKRPTRAIDPTDGTHCLPSYGNAPKLKVMNSPLSSANR